MKNYLLIIAGALCLQSAVVVAKQGIVQEICWNFRGRSMADVTKHIEKNPAGSEARIISELDCGPIGKNYGTLYSTWLLPPATGEYRFWLAADDGGELWLSSDASVDNLKKIASLTGFRPRNSWGSGPGESGLIRLEQGKRYYLRAMQYNAGGGNHLSVAWQGPGFNRTLLRGETCCVPDLDAATAGRIQSLAERELALKCTLDALAESNPRELLPCIEKLSQEEQKILDHQLNQLLDKTQKEMTPEDVLDLKRYVKLAQGLYPSTEHPISNPVLKRLLQLEESYLKGLPFEKLVALGGHRAADALGSIPKSACTLERTVRLNSRQDKSREELVSTALYALPGKPVQVSLPAALAGRNLSLQIGHHLPANDNRHPQFDCMPDTTRNFALNKVTTHVVSPHGGLLFVGVPAGVGLEDTPIVFSGVIAAPSFVLGEQSNEQWRTIRENPAPWGEMISEHMVLLAPREALRAVDNPHELMTWWDKNVQAHHEFYNHTPGFPFRMHAVHYEIMGVSTWPLYTKVNGMSGLLNLRQMEAFHDGLYLHEHGHHCDNGNMIFGNLGESTPNWGGYYLRETMGHFIWKEPTELHITQLLDPENKQHKELRKEQWWNTQWTHYWSYPVTSIMVGYAQSFGWEAFKRCVRRFTLPDDKVNLVFAKAGKEQWSDAHKIDRWVIFMCEESGHDVRPYLDHFCLRPTEAVANYINGRNWPEWDLAFCPKFSISTPVGGPVDLPSPKSYAKTLGGELKLKWSGQPKHGSFTEGAAGRFIYRPQPGFAGTETIPYTLLNEYNNAATGKLEIAVVPAGAGLKMAAGVIDALPTNQWHAVKFSQAYRQPVLIACTAKSAKGKPILRVRNLTASGAEIMAHAQPSGAVKGDASYAIGWLVMESGLYCREEHGINALVGTAELVPETDAQNLTGQFHSCLHQPELFRYSTFGQVLTSSNVSAAQFYKNDVRGEVGFRIGCQMSAVAPVAGLSAEKVGYALFEPGLYQLNGIEVHVDQGAIQVGDIEIGN